MKIAYLARRQLPSVHAHGVQIMKMCEAFAANGHEVVLFAVPGDGGASSLFERYGIETPFRTEIHPRRMKWLKKPRFVAWLLRQPFVRRADLFFGRDIASLAAAARFGKPLVYEAHAIPAPGTMRWRILRYLTGRPNFARLVCVTSTLADLHRQQFPALAGKSVLVLPNGASEPAPTAKVDPWPGRPDAVQVGFVGRPFPGKGIEMMVAAAGHLPDIDFHVVGAGEHEIGWIGQPLPPNLHLHGYQPHGSLGGYLARFDIAAAPYGAEVMNASRVESAAITSPLKLLEYMAAGLPSIVSDLPGVYDIMDDASGRIALVVPAGDQQAFEDALRTLANDPKLRQEIGKAARSRFLDRHTMEARARLALEGIAPGYSSSSSSSKTSSPRLGK